MVTQHDCIIDLSGQILIDANMGNAYNVDDVDVSQFTDVFIVNPTSDNPLQNYELVTLKLLDADDDLPIKKEWIDEPSAVLQEVHVQSGKKQGIEIIEISSESDNVVSSDHNTHDPEEKRDVESIKKLHEKDTEKRKLDEKHDVITDDDNEKSDVPEDVGEKCDVITKEKDAEKRDVPDEVGKSDVGEKCDVITEEKDAEKCDVPDDVRNSDVGEKCDGKNTEKRKSDEEVGKGNVVKKHDGITDVPGVGDKCDVITEEKDDEKRDVPHEVGKGNVKKDSEDVESDVGNKGMEILDAADKKDVGESMVTHEEDTEKREEV